MSPPINRSSASSLGLLGELELAVMDHFWDRGESDVKAVFDALGAPRGIRLNTVQSTVKRLHEKGLLQRRKVSHAYRYAACCSRRDHQRMALQAVVDNVMDGETGAMLAAFVDLAARAGDAELDRLEALIAARKEAESDA